MNKNQKLNHMLALTEEVNILTQRIKPTATGHIHTTISTLRGRIDELKEELSDKPPKSANTNTPGYVPFRNYVADGGEELDDGVTTNHK